MGEDEGEDCLETSRSMARPNRLLARLLALMRWMVTYVIGRTMMRIAPATMAMMVVESIYMMIYLQFGFLRREGEFAESAPFGAV